MVTLFLGFVVVLAAVTSFEPAYEAEENESDEVEQWNLGIILVGVSLLLFMTAKIAIFVWAPQFVQQTFESGPELAGEFMGNVFLAAFLGSLAGTWLASKISVRFLLYGFVLLSLLSVYAISSAQSTSSILFLGYCYGLSVSATYNSYVAFGLAFVSSPSHKNVVYLQLMSGLGSAVAPVMSSLVVHEVGSTRSALQLCFVLLLTVVLTLVISDALYRRRTFA